MLAPDRLVLGLEFTGAYARVAHDVPPDELEPGLSAQPTEHQLDLGFVDVQLTALYGLGPRLGLELLVPLRLTRIDATFLGPGGVQQTGFESIHHRDETIAGLGDPTVALRWNVRRRSKPQDWSIDVRAGSTLPFGRIEPDPFELGRAGQRHQHLFYGNGTFDPIFGLEATGRIAALETFTFLAARTPRAQNRYGYRGSTQLSLGFGLGHGLFTRNWLFFILPELRHESAARWGERQSENSGRSELSLGLGASSRFALGTQLYFIVKRPILLQVEGGQLSLPFTGVVGLRWALEL